MLFSKSIFYILLLLSTFSVKAALITQQFSIEDDNLGYDVSSSVWFNSFDPSIGTLLDVRFVIDGVWEGNASFTNPFAFPVDAYFMGRAYTSFGIPIYKADPLLEYIHPQTFQLSANEQINLTGNQAVQWLMDFNYQKDYFIGTVPLEYLLMVEHSQAESRLYDLIGNSMPRPNGYGAHNYHFDSTNFRMVQNVTVLYSFCSKDQVCSASVSEPNTYGLMVLGLGLLICMSYYQTISGRRREGKSE